MTYLMTPVFEGHDLKSVEQWTLEDLGWWYLIRARRSRDEYDAQKEAERKAKEKRR